jgi:hypothetical protein
MNTKKLAEFAAATDNQIFDPELLGGTWLFDVVETQDKISDFIHGMRYVKSCSPAKRGRVAGCDFVAWDSVQIDDGDPRQEMSVLDVGTCRYAITGVNLHDWTDVTI